MGTFRNNDNSVEIDIYVQRLSSYIRKNEESLANGLLCFSKNRNPNKVKPLRLSFTIHHLYCIVEKIESSPLGVDVGPLNIKLDSPNHEPTFISFMANNARSSKHFESDAKSITSINSMKSIVLSASVYWRNFTFSKDPKIVNKDLRYLYSSFTKIPCLILTPKTKIGSISGYEEYPCDTSVPIKMFKNLQVLELIDYEPNEIFGWNTLSEQLRILIIRNSKINDITEILFTLVIDDENGRSSFNNHKQLKKNEWLHENHYFNQNSNFSNTDHDSIANSNIKYRRERAATTTLTGTTGSLPKDFLNDLKFSSQNSSEKSYQNLPDNKWSFLKQLTVSETSITSIPNYIFKPLNNLVKLNLSGNLLQELPDGLDQLTNVKYLNFADNYITNLKSLPTNLKYLSTLNFNNNKLEDIKGIESLVAIEKIDFRRNQLKTVECLRPIVLQFINSSDKFNNIYLSGNGLPKNYRTDMFNLFNGIKYKNSMKIDDSRPGYFESALLFDAEGAFKFLQKFLDLDKDGAVSSPDSTNADGALLDKLSPPVVIKKQSAKSQLQAINKGHTRASKSTSDINEILDPLSSLNLSNALIANTRRSTIITKTIASQVESPTNSSPKSFTETNSIISSTPVQYKQPSPLGNNQNLSNQLTFEASSFTTTKSTPATSIIRHSFHLPPNSPSNLQARSLKHSSTMNQLDLESMNNPAPSVITPVQVQVEGFQ